jgi:hypothetical protein
MAAYRDSIFDIKAFDWYQRWLATFVQSCDFCKKREIKRMKVNKKCLICRHDLLGRRSEFEPE